MTSRALWLPLLWFVILSSRPISLWFGGGLRVENPDDYLEGSPFDRNVFLLLMVMGLGVLAKRRVNWGTILRSNIWLFAFFFYCALSAIWSDYTFVSFKRWIKDFGNLVMVLIVVSEKSPVQAITALLARCMYFALPVSVVLIKYFPELGRVVSSTWENASCGVTTDKNSLGCLAFSSGMFLVWDFLQVRAATEKNPDRADRVDLWARGFLFLMVFWLLYEASSSTADVCLVLGSSIILLLQWPFSRRQVRFLGAYCLMGACAAFLLYASGFFETFVQVLGEDVTLTGRTELWGELMMEPINPLLGTGYQSFWLGPRAEVYWEKWIFHPNQAHNGYIETYLNGGLIGLFLLVAAITSTGIRLKKRLLRGGNYEILLFAFFVVVLLYNWTEAMFNKLSPMWFLILMASLNYSTSTWPQRATRLEGVKRKGGGTQTASNRKSVTSAQPGAFAR